MKQALSTAIDYLQAKFPPAKLVTALSPLILLGSAYASTWCAQHLPGLPTFTAVQGALVAAPVVLGVATILYQRIDGWQKNDRLEQEHSKAIAQMLLDAGHYVELVDGELRFPGVEPVLERPVTEPTPLVSDQPLPGEPPTPPK